jgi:hypothetical protein
MSSFRISILAILAGGIAVIRGQAIWDANQVNTTMCYWEELRGAVVRDTVYLDGGDIWWIPGYANGSTGAIENDANPMAVVYTLNFSVPFNTSQNITAIMAQLPKVAGGNKANNIAPNYYDGAMLANDDEWYIYGGLLRKTDAFTPPHSDDVLSYQAYQYGAQKDAFQPGFVNDELPDGLSRYLAYGGAASAPSENKAWYFSGMHSPLHGEIFRPDGNDSETAINVSSTLITLDMAVQQQETWSNKTLPALVPGRANPQLVWVPVGKEGILVALGGVVFPEFVSALHVSSNEAQSKADSPAFMSNINIYDVAGDKWYQQPTTGGPGALARGCAVVAPAQDASSFNIYHYGGYNGIDYGADFNDDVWVLSLPSFTWTKVAESTAGHGRAGHKCFMPYPDQMLVIGGYMPLTGDAPSCLDGGIIQLFNVSSGRWMSEYNPTKWSNYTVPDTVVKNIGGSPTGGATASTPGASGWATAALGSVFATPYPTTKITKYYPYTPTQSKNNTNPSYSPDPKSGSRVPSYLAPLLGTIFGLMFVTLVVTGIFLWRRRKLLRRNGPSEFGTDDSNGHRIMSWIRGQPHPDHKESAITSTTEETPGSPSTGIDTPPVLYHPAYPAMTEVMHHEVPNNQIAELMDTSPPAELSDTGLSPLDIISGHSRLGSTNPCNNASNYSSTIQTEDTAAISQPSPSAGPAPAPPLVSPNLSRPDSPPLGRDYVPSPPEPAPNPLDESRVTSGVSSVSEETRAHLRQISDATVGSERDKGHLRQISDATVSSTGNGGAERPLPVVGEAGERPRPKTGGSAGLAVGSGSPGGTSRRSISRESIEDMGSH